MPVSLVHVNVTSKLVQHSKGFENWEFVSMMVKPSCLHVDVLLFLKCCGSAVLRESGQLVQTRRNHFDPRLNLANIILINQ